MKYTLAALAAATIVVAQLDQIPVCAVSSCFRLLFRHDGRWKKIAE